MPSGGTQTRIVITQASSADVNLRTDKWCDTADELLE